jgi:hypothetical protein
MIQPILYFKKGRCRVNVVDEKGWGVCFGLEIRQVSNTDRYDGKVLSMLDIRQSALNCTI